MASYTKEQVQKWNDMSDSEQAVIWNNLSENEREQFDADFDAFLKTKTKTVAEDPVVAASSPAPLLADKKAALPEGSKERAFYENFEKTIDNTASNTGSGFDTMTREGVKATQQIVRSSPMLQDGLNPPRPSEPGEGTGETGANILGQEEGKAVSNIQSWHTPIGNAIKPISDAVGSCLDVTHSLNKTPIGSAQLLPTAVTALVDNISSQITNQVDAISKTIQSSGLANMASKALGSLRNLATAGDKILSVAYDLLSDVSNGIDNIITALSNIVDKIVTLITNFAISLIGGLINAMFPPALLETVTNSLNKLTGGIGDIAQMLGGFTAVTSITNQLGGLTSSFSSTLSNPANLVKSYLPSPQSLLGKLPGGEILSSLTDQVPGFPGINGGSIGNIGTILTGVSPKIGSMLPSIRDPGQLIKNFVPPEIAQQIDKIDQIPGLGMIGNPGFSVGKIMDSLTDTAATVAMGKFATHAAIIGPLLNKEIGGAQANQTSFAVEPQPDEFQNAPFVPGAQSNKGITMVGPIGTQYQRVFPGPYATIGGGGSPPPGVAANQQAENSGGMSQTEIDASIAASNPEAAKKIAEMRADSNQWYEKARQARIASEQ
jgi:hypothetical protein